MPDLSGGAPRVGFETVTTSVMSPWEAPFATARISGRISLPGSKSMTNRALLLAALAAGPTTITRPLLARDTRLMVSALTALGVEVDETADGLRVVPRELTGPAYVDCGLAGTVMRFVPPVAALATGQIRFDGDTRARERPMSDMLRALGRLGVGFEGTATALPFTVDGTGEVEGGRVRLDASASSQFISALLLAGARYRRGVDVRHDGEPVPSLPHIEMSVQMLRARGVEVDDSEPNRWVVSPGEIAAADTQIEPDLSNAAPFLAAAAITGGSVSVDGWPSSTSQPGDRLRGIFEAMGAQVALTPAGLNVTGPGQLRGIDVDLHETGELTPVVAALAAVAGSPSYLRGVAHLRGHETDRLAALAKELGARGGDVRETPDGLEIRPRRLTGGLFHTYSDHRMAHAAAVLGLVVQGIRVDDVATTSKTHPDFVGAWMAMLG
jgi:3-phosphoshikimate 1-carboxyvinyltransferase